MSRHSRPASWTICCWFTSALLSACSNITGDEQFVADAAALPAVNGQLGTVGASLADSVGVLVLDRLGQPMVGIPVQWRADSAMGVLEPARTLTDRSGVARANWRLDTIAGLQSATATVQGFATAVRVFARALPGAVTSLTIEDTTSGSLVVGRSRALATRRADSYGNPHVLGTPRWLSLDPAVATVSSAGLLTGVLAGTARIVAQQDNGADTLVLRIEGSGEVDWIAFAVGGAGVGGHACAIDVASRIWCWGYNDGGQLGTGNIVPRNAPVRAFHDTSLTFRVVRTGAGNSRLSCALRESHVAYCWGETAIGDGSTARRQPSPVQMPSGVGFADVQIGRDHACARTTEGRVYCWGTNGSGQTGHGGSVSSVVPRLVAGVDSVVSLALAADASCAATVRGVVWCWGRNARGELASGDTLARSTPRPVAGLSSVRSVHAGEQHFCAISVDGLWCWGRNDAGQLGLETSGDQLVPLRISAAVYRQLGGGTRHTCAVTSTGAVDCWGANIDGQLGTGDTRDARSPQRIAALGGLRMAGISLSGNTSCALSEGGELFCWGSDAQGQLGNGTAPASLLPIRVSRPRP